MEPVEKFTNEAAAFEHWLLHGTESGGAAVRECLRRLLALLAAGIELPPARADGLADRDETEPVSDAEWRMAYEAAQRLPVDYYGEVYDPTLIPPDEPGVGSIADDLADIFRDVVGGLRMYRRGDLAGAVWEWSFGLRAHWGAHATSAVRALYWWSRENAGDTLSAAIHEPGESSAEP